MNQVNPLSDEYIFVEKEASKTKWINNNTDTATFRLLTNEKRVGRDNERGNPSDAKTGWHKDGSKCQGSIFLRVVLRPGESIELPSEYDNAIRKVNKDTGLVCGGLVPWLSKVGEENPPALPDEFDYKSAVLQAEAMNVLKSVKRETELRSAFKALEEKTQRKEQEKEARKALEESLKAEKPAPKKSGRPKKEVVEIKPEE